MTREDFVKAVKTEALDTAVRDTILDLQDPAGRKPAISLIRIHEWYEALDAESQKFVEQVARMAAESATFGLMAILDGVRAVESGGDKGALVLEYRKGTTKTLLNDFHQKLLHDILAGWFGEVSTPRNLAVDLHHIPQSHLMAKHVAGYVPENATVIALPTREHRSIPVEREEPDRAVTEQLDKDLENLRDYTGVPDSVIENLRQRIMSS